MSSERHQKTSALAYVLHTTPWKETSLIVEIFTQAEGRLALLAKGARRPRSAVRGVLRAFQPLELTWIGAQELRTLTHAEWQGWQALLEGEALYCGLYLNELLLKLLARDDPHPALFDAYGAALQALGNTGASAIGLRRFELLLLKEIGYGLDLTREARSGEAVLADRLYTIDPVAGPVLASPSPNAVQFSGEALWAIAEDDWNDPQTVQTAKNLMRIVLQHHLGTHALKSRSLFKEIAFS